MNKNIKRLFIPLLMAVFLITLAGTLSASEKNDYDVWRQVAERAAGEALQRISGEAGDLLVLTNAGYAVVGGSPAGACLDGLSAATGCTAGKGSLLELHSAWDRPLWFFFFDSASGESVYCQVDSAAVPELLAGKADPEAIAGDKLFKILSRENIDAKKLLADPSAWNKKVTEKVFGGNEFGIVTIANIAAMGAPADFTKAALFHDHLCPGVNSGYLLAKYLQKEFPLGSDESYCIIAIPNWCKDDALQILLNATPGKSGLAVIPMNAKAKETLKPEAKNLAGIYFRWNAKTQKGEGLVLGYDFDKGTALSGIDMNKGFSWETRLKSDIWYMNYFDKPETFISVIKKFELQAGEEPLDYAQPGVNPLVKLGLTK